MVKLVTVIMFFTLCVILVSSQTTDRFLKGFMGSKAPKIKPLKETKTKAPKGSWVKKVKKTKGPKDAKKKAKKSPPTLEPTAASTI